MYQNPNVFKTVQIQEMKLLRKLLLLHFVVCF